MKIVLDTNVLINGFRDEYSYEKKIIDAVIAGELEAYANRQTLRENKLISRQLINNVDYEKQLNNLFAQINWVQNRRQIRVVSDPEDNKILESAVEAKADYLITSDNALLNLQKYQEVRIVNPSEFWVKYKDEGLDLWKQWANFIKNNK
ncbi:MAG: putative toxin-antitoxin system toxin component, PIN family [Patescibacteria group bacterium]|nr:putative toxin-antitoxin system toxin component, PIN family [Patescibacteria group bacterium]